MFQGSKAVLTTYPFMTHLFPTLHELIVRVFLAQVSIQPNIEVLPESSPEEDFNFDFERQILEEEDPGQVRRGIKSMLRTKQTKICLSCTMTSSQESFFCHQSSLTCMILENR